VAEEAAADMVRQVVLTVLLPGLLMWFLSARHTDVLSRTAGSSEIPNRYLKHGFRVENSYLSSESLSTGPRAPKRLANAPHQINAF
jgi:hypothetical protein